MSGSQKLALVPKGAPPPSRPAFLTALAWINIVGGAIAFFAGLGGNNVAMVIGGAFAIVVGNGLLRLRPWARWLAIVGYALTAVNNAVAFNAVGIVVSCLFLGYLSWSRDVKMAFARRPATLEASQPSEASKEKAA